MTRRFPSRVPETGPLPSVRELQKTVNQLIDLLRASELREGPKSRIERTFNGTVIHTRSSVVTGGTDDTWY